MLPNQQDDNFSVSVERGAINFQQGILKKFPISINQWISAFLIYASIFIQKTLSDAGNLFKYIYMIRDMSFTTKTDSWRYYDEEVRKLRQSVPLPWQEPLQELVMRTNLQPFKFRSSNQPFLAKSKSNNFQNSKADLTHASTSMSVSTVKSSTLGSSAPNSPQMRNGYPKKMPTPVKPEILKTYLEGYEQDYLISGFTYGFHLGCLNTPSSTPSKNHGSTNKHPEIVLNKIKKEQSYGRIPEASPNPQYLNLVISPLEVVPKKVQGQFRLIHD